MRHMLVVVAALILSIIGLQPTVAEASCYTNGYTRSNGTYVSGYYRSCPDSTVRNNYTYNNNYNPYTYERGTNRYYTSPSSEWYSPSYWP